MIPQLRWLIAVLALTSIAAAESGQRFTSGPEQVSLLEMYTSQGCSSCPPLDEWLSSLKNGAEIWRRWVPIAFHVTYWDHLGWRDPFSQKAFDRRQRDYASMWRSRSGVYTPALVLNGREWRGWLKGQHLLQGKRAEVGELTMELDEGRAKTRFISRMLLPTRLRLHLALLGFDLQKEIPAGENAGRVLTHDFVVLAYSFDTLDGTGSLYEGAFRLPALETENPTQRVALAAWVSQPDDPTPLQALGGWLLPSADLAKAH